MELIQKVISFTEKDLEANRRLEITDAQLNRLRSVIDYFYKRAILGLIISTVVLFIMAAAGQLEALSPQQMKTSGEPKLLIFFMVLVVMVIIVSFLIILWSLIQFRNYNEKLTVRVTEGKVKRTQDEYTNIVKVGDVEFYLDDTKYAAFTGEYYRVYYLDSSDILSVETPETKI
jgi:hypothetical protein